jgi:hypothetical protein
MNSNKYFILIIIAAISCMFYSCYKDKGNYNYKKLNRINKIENIQKEYSIYRGEDILKITPKISFDIKENKDKYEYKWILHISKKEKMVISTKKNLVFDSKGKKFPIQKLNLTFIAKNLTTKVSISKTFKVKFMHKYTNGVFILHENNGNSELTFINKNNIVAKNIYQKITGRQLKGLPVKICAKKKINGDVKNGIILILTNCHNYGAVLNYSNLKYRYPVSNCFRRGNPSKNLIFNFPYIKSFLSNYFFSIDGKLYRTNFDEQTKTHPYITLSFPVITNDNKIDYIHNELGIVHSANGNLYINHSNLLKIEGKVFRMRGKCFYMFSEPFYSEQEQKIHILIKESNNTVKEYVLTMMIDEEEEITCRVESHLFAVPEYITEKSFFANSSLNKYCYIAQANKIYRYNYDAPNDRPSVFKEFDTNIEITYFKMIKTYKKFGEIKNEKGFVVCTYNPNETDKNKAASLYYINYEGKSTHKFRNICGKINSIVIKE